MIATGTMNCGVRTEHRHHDEITRGNGGHAKRAQEHKNGKEEDRSRDRRNLQRGIFGKRGDQGTEQGETRQGKGQEGQDAVDADAPELQGRTDGPVFR
jgi:hypothetical protein